MTSDNQGGTVPELPEFKHHLFPFQKEDLSYEGERITTANNIAVDLDDAIDALNAVYLPGGLRDKAEQLERRCREMGEAIRRLLDDIAYCNCSTCFLCRDKTAALALLTDAAGEKS